MGIVTKNGDRGKTFLYSGRLVSKDHARIETCGSLDELFSFLGMAKSLIKQSQAKKTIAAIQHDLLIIGTELACDVRCIKRLKKRIGKEHTLRIEGLINNLENSRKVKVSNFCLTGDNPVSAALDVARAVSRRVERDAVRLKRIRLLRNSEVIVYLNRLSDLLYLLARSYA